MTRSGLLTHAYGLTMAGSYLRRGMTAPGIFSLFVRQLAAFGTLGRDGQVFLPGRWRA